jgi:signal transduction histidine kinase
LLINSGKHAGTGQADVALEERNGHLHITVHDDGVGFDVAAAAAAAAADSPTGGLSSKFGLFSIRERMLALGGSFDLQSTPGKGYYGEVGAAARLAERDGSPVDTTPNTEPRTSTTIQRTRTGSGSCSSTTTP